MIGHEAQRGRFAAGRRGAIERFTPVARILPLDRQIEGDRAVETGQHFGLRLRQGCGNNEGVQVAAIVDLFRAIDERATHQRDAADILPDLWIGILRPKRQRRANLRARVGSEGGTRHPHTLNGSALALPRTLITLLETAQDAEGNVTIPEPLRPYMGGLDRLTVRDRSRR